MGNRRRLLLRGTWMIVTYVVAATGMMNAALEQHPVPNMPARNPWLADSVYPTSHFNGGATDSVLFAGPTKGKKLVRDKDVKVVSNVMVSNPAVKKIGADTVGFASGTLGILKILLTGKSLEAVSFTAYPLPWPRADSRKGRREGRRSAPGGSRCGSARQG
jgi:hypothetical protein